jgi:hypothetical protein
METDFRTWYTKARIYLEVLANENEDGQTFNTF